MRVSETHANRSLALFLCLMIIGCAPTLPKIKGPSRSAGPASTAICGSKRGLLVNHPVDQQVINNFGTAPIYYSYETFVDQNRTIYGPFVPMFSEPVEVTSTNLARAQANGNTLLAFNEPDGGTQFLSTDTALSYWPTFESLGMRLGAPAVSRYAGASKAWIDDFMTKANSLHYRVDFLPVHYYGVNEGLVGNPQAAASEMIRQLNELHNTWGKPIWVTEFALSMETESSYAANLQFMQAVLPQLDSMPFVEYYFWWTPNSYRDAQVGSTNSLTDANFNLNSLGLYYRDSCGG